MNATTDQFSAVSAIELTQVEGGLINFGPIGNALYLALAIGAFAVIDMGKALGDMVLPKTDPWS